MEGLAPVTSHANYLLDVRIKNHGAMTALTQGRATREDMDILVASLNIVEALYRRGFGADYKDVVHAGLEALRSVGARGAATNKFILRADEMRALNEAMELHDAQLEVITVRDMDIAVKDVRNEFLQGRMIPITTKEKTNA
jgi:hypothetical protein